MIPRIASSQSTASAPVVGIDLGGTHMQVGVVAEASGSDAKQQAEIIGRGRAKTRAEDGRDAVIDRIVAAVHTTCEDAGVPLDAIDAVGIAAPGAIDMPRGIVLEAPNLGWRDVPLQSMLSEMLGRPVVVDNDVNGAVWGEFHLGAGRGTNDLLGVWVGTGVGGGLVLSGALHHGPLHSAGEIGHTVVRPEAASGRRTLEDLASRTGMSRLIVERLMDVPGSMLRELVDPATGITGSKQLAKAFAARDPLAVQIIETGARLIGIAIANQVTMLAIDRVVVGGGVTEALGEAYLDMIRTSFDTNVFPERCRACRIVMTELEADAGLLGAAMLARNRETTPRLNV